MQALKFGLLAETAAQLDDLTLLVKQAGHEIAFSIRANSASEELSCAAGAEAWVVRLNLQNDKALVLVEQLESFNLPVIYDDIESYAELGLGERVNRFAAKLQLCAGTTTPPQGSTKAAEIWVLAASTGGPEAVTSFLKTLPTTVSGVAFVYVQHINPEISATLQRALVRNTTWTVLNCNRSQQLMEKCIYVVPPDHQVDIHSTGVISPLADTWLGRYSPSADQVMARVARNYGKNGGAIIFSGMGDDGSRSCGYMHGSGGIIWAQSPLTCAVDSMPCSAIKTGHVSYQGSPENLAHHFMYGRHISLLKKSSQLRN